MCIQTCSWDCVILPCCFHTFRGLTGCPGLHVQLLQDVRHGWLVQHIDDNNLKAAAAAGLHGIYPRANAATAAATAAALAERFSVRAWGVKNVEVTASKRTCEWHVDAIAQIA
jgi:hypothetical protein